jgi:glycosyltransferase involved in cell wall biosynthesis
MEFLMGIKIRNNVLIMSIESDYIYSLEKKIKSLEGSRGYRWTRPGRKVIELISNLVNVVMALPLLFNSKKREQFDKVNYSNYIKNAYKDNYGIARSDNVNQNSQKKEPVVISGRWINYPWLHYCIFNRNIEIDHKESDSYESLDPEKPTVILITHDTSRTGAPILVYDLLWRYKKSYNVVVFSINKGDISNAFKNMATVFVEPISLQHITDIVGSDLQRIKAKSNRVHAIANSIVSTEILNEFWNHDIPTIHLIHEFSSYTRPRSRFDDSLFYSDSMIFSADIALSNAMESSPSIDKAKAHVIPQGVCQTPKTELNDQKVKLSHNYLKSTLRPEGWPDDTIVVLGAGSVHIRKGVDLFVACAKRVQALNTGKKIRFVWIGAGFKPETDLFYSCFLADQIKRAELGDAFSIINEIEEFDEIYRLIDIFFLSSRLDPLPLVAQGALFNKVPLVCFDRAGGIPEYLKQDGSASEGVVPFLDIELAAQKIYEFIENKELALKTAEAGYGLAKKLFDQERYFTTLNKVHDNIILERKVESEDKAYISQFNLCNINYSYPQFVDNRALAVKHYVRSWRKNIHLRKPFPGFHPGVYQDFHPGCGDPLVHYHQSGSLHGVWNSEVLTMPHSDYDTAFLGNDKAALHIHLHYPEVAREIFSRIKQCRFRPDLFVSVTTKAGKEEIEKLMNDDGFMNYQIKVVPNRGRDIGPLFTGFREIFDCGYDFIGHLHGKKSVTLGGDTGKAWAHFLYENLLGGQERMMDLIMERMIADPTIGIVFPDDPHAMGWNKNKEYAEVLAKRMNLKIELPRKSLNFPVGTMFWARTNALKPIIDLNLEWEDFPPEPVPYDGTMLHALERMLPLIAEHQGYRYAVTYVPGISR